MALEAAFRPDQASIIDDSDAGFNVEMAIKRLADQSFVDFPDGVFSSIGLSVP